MIQGINHLHESSVRSSPLTVTDMVIDSILVRVRDLYKHLSEEERQILLDFLKSEKPIALITNRFSAQQQSQLIDEILREGSFTCMRIPGYLKVALTGISASQKFYSSFWSSKATDAQSSTPARTQITSLDPIKVSIYRPQDRFEHRPRRPGGVHVGPRKPLEFKVYNPVQNPSIFHTIHHYMRSILPNVF